MTLNCIFTEQEIDILKDALENWLEDNADDDDTELDTDVTVAKAMLAKLEALYWQH